jgi:hypothetical protein
MVLIFVEASGAETCIQPRGCKSAGANDSGEGEPSESIIMRMSHVPAMQANLAKSKHLPWFIPEITLKPSKPEVLDTQPVQIMVEWTGRSLLQIRSSVEGRRKSPIKLDQAVEQRTGLRIDRSLELRWRLLLVGSVCHR